MKKLRIILVYSLTIFTIIYCNITINKKDKYEEITEISGVIENIEITDSYINLLISGNKKYLLKTKVKDNYKLGYKIKAYGKNQIPNKNTIPNLFNYKKYLKSKKIKYIFYADKIEIKNTKLNIIYNLKNKIYNQIEKNKNTNGYLKTFILGDNSSIDDNVLKSFSNNGISHLFSISGMHISLFTIMLFKILGKIIKNENINYIIVFIFLLFYLVLTNFLVSLIRSIFMFILSYINKKLNLKIKTYNLLIFICCILLIYNPFYVYNLGFLFSFTISFFLIFFSNIINTKKNYFSKLLIVSIVSFLVSIPILINNFFCINLLSIIYNLIFVPFVSFILFPLSLITFILPIFNNLFLIFINILETLSLFFNEIKILNITLCHLNFIFILIYYLIIIFVLYKINQKKYYYILIIIIFLFIHNNILILNNKNLVSFIDVGQGDSELIIFPHNKANILIDTGGIRQYNNENNYSIVLNKTILYLKSLGVKKINYLILTHGDYDHMGDAINLVNNFKVEKVIFNCGEFNDLESELINVLNKKKIPYYSCIKELNVGNNKLYFLQTKEYDNENDNSNVIYTEIDDNKFMFMGDAGIEKEKDILDKYNISNIDVLKVGHHGSKTSSSEEFINEINPKYSIISVGKNNRYGHPNKEVLNVLNNSKIYRTDQDGSIMFKIKNNKLEIETCSP